jgi:nucleoside-diphosphate-sugar epimerase
LIHVSSSAVYGRTLDGDLTEETPWQPDDHPYTAAKRATEECMLSLYRDQSLPVVIIQPTIVYGPHAKAWTLDTIALIRSKLVPLVDGGDGLCNAVYVDDVADAMIKAAVKSDILGETFLVSGAEPITWATFSRGFERVIGVDGTIELSRESVGEMMAQQQAKTRSETGGGSFGQLMQLARHPKVAKRLSRIPMVRGPLAVMKMALSEQSYRKLTSRFRTNGREESPTSAKPVLVPNETLLALYSAKTRVRITKAVERLGYSPKFDFDSGMKLTAQYVRWAKLA